MDIQTTFISMTIRRHRLSFVPSSQFFFRFLATFFLEVTWDGTGRWTQFFTRPVPFLCLMSVEWIKNGLHVIPWYNGTTSKYAPWRKLSLPYVIITTITIVWCSHYLITQIIIFNICRLRRILKTSIGERTRKINGKQVACFRV